MPQTHNRPRPVFKQAGSAGSQPCSACREERDLHVGLEQNAKEQRAHYRPQRPELELAIFKDGVGINANVPEQKETIDHRCNGQLGKRIRLDENNDASEQQLVH